MIKKGDKVICIKLDYLTEKGNLQYLNMSIGEIYEIYESIYENNSIISVIINGRTFGIGNEKRIRQFQDYFVPLAEWREQQINSILDD